jgi:hypothetical protein
VAKKLGTGAQCSGLSRHFSVLFTSSVTACVCKYTGYILQNTGIRLLIDWLCFDKVRGVAAKLFTVRDGMFCQALNTAAGGKLYNVVIDTEEVSNVIATWPEL